MSFLSAAISETLTAGPRSTCGPTRRKVFVDELPLLNRRALEVHIRAGSSRRATSTDSRVQSRPAALEGEVFGCPREPSSGTRPGGEAAAITGERRAARRPGDIVAAFSPPPRSRTACRASLTRHLALTR